MMGLKSLPLVTAGTVPSAKGEKRGGEGKAIVIIYMGGIKPKIRIVAIPLFQMICQSSPLGVLRCVCSRESTICVCLFVDDSVRLA